MLEVLRDRGTRISLKINVKKTKSITLGTNENELLVVGNKKIGQIDTITCMGSIISKDEECSVRCED